MTGISFAMVLQASMLLGGGDYSDAYQETQETGRPLVVLVGADWCPACRTMKTSVIPEAQRRGVLGKVSFAVVNTDRQSSIARKLMRGGSIPQLIVFHKTDDGWKRRQMTGVQSVSDIESAVNSALKDVELKLTHASQDQKMN